MEEQYIEIDKYGNKYYYKDKAMTIHHRLDGPAYESADGTKSWWVVNGKRHRLDEPAIEAADAYKAWYVDGKRHRLDGPAIEWANGYKEWWVNGKRLSEGAFDALSKPLELTLDQIAAKFGVDVRKIKIVK